MQLFDILSLVLDVMLGLLNLLLYIVKLVLLFSQFCQVLLVFGAFLLFSRGRLKDLFLFVLDVSVYSFEGVLRAQHHVSNMELLEAKQVDFTFIIMAIFVFLLEIPEAGALLVHVEAAEVAPPAVLVAFKLVMAVVALVCLSLVLHWPR